MNFYQYWKEKLEGALSHVFQYCEITVSCRYIFLKILNWTVDLWPLPNYGRVCRVTEK